MNKTIQYYQNKHEYGIPKSVCGIYQVIWAWGKMSGSMDYYIANQVVKAIKDEAPANATYYDSDKKMWHTLDDTCEVTKRRIESILNR